MKICVIIPTFNESKRIAVLVKQVRSQGFEVVVVDDGSQDQTSRIAEEAGAVVLVNEVNQGKGASLIRGFGYVLSKGFDAVITMDGDGQHLPQDLPLFLDAAKSPDSAIIVGNRMSLTKAMPWVRIATNKFMSWLISSMAGQQIPDTQCGFRLIKKEVLEKIKLETSKYEIESEMLINAARLKFKIKSVPITTVYRGEKSQINPVVDTLRFIRFIWRQLWKKPV